MSLPTSTAGPGGQRARARRMRGPRSPCALRGDRNAARPEAGAAAGLVRRHREAQPPAPVTAEAAQQQSQHRPLEAQRRGVADVARQAALADAPSRRAHEQHEMPPDHR